jgi:hypothetical protein
MHDRVKSALLSILLLVTTSAWAGGDEWRESPKPADTSWYRASLTPTVNGTPVAPSVRNVAPDTDRSRTQGVLASTIWLKGAFSTETEVAANRAASPADDPSGRMMRLGLMGSQGLLRYGMTYRTSDSAFYQAPGHEQREAWGEWKSGVVAIRTAVGQRTTLDADASDNRMPKNYHRIDVSWGRPAWPRLSLKYAQNAGSNATDPLSLFPQKADHHNVEAAIGYGAALWEAKVASSYGLETDLLQRSAESRVQTETLTASFRPANIVTITPAVGYRVEQQPWSGARINSPSATLSMNYKQSQRLSMTAMGNYSSTRSSDQLVDLDMIGGKGVLTWELEPVRDWKPQLTVEGGYNLQVNRLMPSAQTENLSGLLRFVLATM